MPSEGEAGSVAVTLSEVPSIDPEPTEKTIEATAFSDQLTRIPPVEIFWKDLTLDVPVPSGAFKKKQTKQILNGISGYARPGEMLAIMGSTGAGKTSLLNVLARRADGVSTGVILINGKPIGSSMKFAGYVLQSVIGGLLPGSPTPPR
jgi:ABC-type multidrug transport system fused ATPase/permease subunit